MKLDLYHLYRGFHFSKLTYPIVLDVLKVWAEQVGWQARVNICKEAHVDLKTDAQVVGISVYTQTAPAAYRVSRELRRRGKIVILGGPHFRGHDTYEEAAPFCDAIVSSTSERQWHQLLENISAGRLEPGAQAPQWISDSKSEFRYPANFYQALRSRRWYQVPTIPTTIGCPYDCNFCSAYMQGRYVLRDVETVYNEVAYTKGKMVVFCDATFGLNKRFTIELMDAIAPLGKKIAVETTLSRLRDREFLDALARGGVKWLVVGIETLAYKMSKHGAVHPERNFRDVMDRIHERGMVVQGNFICGLDEDGPRSFEDIYRYYEKSTLDGIMIGILTPYPHTSLYRRLESEGRLFDRNWENYDCHNVVFRPRKMTADQLVDGYIWLYKKIRETRSIFREALDAYDRSGFSLESAIVVGNNLYQKFDSLKKEKLLRASRPRMNELLQPKSRPGLVPSPFRRSA